jgi:hypothetical protein
MWKTTPSRDSRPQERRPPPIQGGTLRPLRGLRHKRWPSRPPEAAPARTRSQVQTERAVEQGKATRSRHPADIKTMSKSCGGCAPLSSLRRYAPTVPTSTPWRGVNPSPTAPTARRLPLPPKAGQRKGKSGRLGGGRGKASRNAVERRQGRGAPEVFGRVSAARVGRPVRPVEGVLLNGSEIEIGTRRRLRPSPGADPRPIGRRRHGVSHTLWEELWCPV